MAQEKFKAKILVVDDEKEACEILKNWLERANYSVVIAENGEDGIVKMQDQGIDIIISDIVMPKMDGMEFLQKVRKFNLKAEVIIVTGQSSIERCLGAIEQNALTYLIKPFKLEELLAAVIKAQERIEEKKAILQRAIAEKKKKAKTPVSA